MTSTDPDINPYSFTASQLPELDAATLSAAKAMAKSLAASGSAVPGIAKKLQMKGIDAGNAEEIAIDAVIARSRLTRIAGIVQAVCGLLIVIVGHGIAKFGFVKYGMTIAVLGLFVIALGVAKLFHRIRLRRGI